MLLNESEQLPVRVEAAIALNQLICQQPKISDYMKANLGDIMKVFLTVRVTCPNHNLGYVVPYSRNREWRINWRRTKNALFLLRGYNPLCCWYGNKYRPDIPQSHQLRWWGHCRRSGHHSCGTTQHAGNYVGWVTHCIVSVLLVHRCCRGGKTDYDPVGRNRMPSYCPCSAKSNHGLLWRSPFPSVFCYMYSDFGTRLERPSAHFWGKTKPFFFVFYHFVGFWGRWFWFLHRNVAMSSQFLGQWYDDVLIKSKTHRNCVHYVPKRSRSYKMYVIKAEFVLVVPWLVAIEMNLQKSTQVKCRRRPWAACCQTSWVRYFAVSR